MRFGDSGDRIVIGRLAEQIDRNDRARLEPELLGGGDGALELAGSKLNVSASTSASTGVAPHRAGTSAVAQKVKAGQMTASPGPMPQAISTSRSASVPLEQVITWRAPQKAASSLSSVRTSGPRMNWQCVKTPPRRHQWRGRGAGAARQRR